MKGDFSRFTHDPQKHYTGVLKQQGRVDLDADWNEYVEIRDYLDRTQKKDIIGPCGAPKTGGGFKISPHRLISSLLTEAHFADQSRGWVVGQEGKILTTNDGGNTWSLQTSGVDTHLYGIYFINDLKGWAVGFNGTILNTDDGGENWNLQISKVEERLYGVFFLNESKGWAVGSRDTILTTNDGGNQWTPSHSGVNIYLQKVYFVNDTEGWAAGTISSYSNLQAGILVTTDGGDTWRLKQGDPKVHLYGMSFANRANGWVAGSWGYILVTKNGGESWEKQESSSNVSLYGVHFINESIGWIVGDEGTILATEDGGVKWVKQPSMVEEALMGVHFVDESKGCIVGAQGNILTTDNGGKSWSLWKPPITDLNVSSGRIYVDGILCELEAKTTYLNQPDYPSRPVLEPTEGRTDLVYLDVWQRLITTVEDPDIREIALGGPDTATRIKTITQVKILPDVGSVSCSDDIQKWKEEIAPGGGRLKTQAQVGIKPENPCLIAEGGGYRGLENRLYRMEIHEGGDLGAATFKWSKDNGSIAYEITEFIPDDVDPTKVFNVGLKQFGKDEALKIKENDWLEVSGDETDLDVNNPGTLAQVVSVDEVQRIFTLSVDVASHKDEAHPKVRRWDTGPNTVISPTLTAAGPIKLEDGIEIYFSGSNFKVGDYWVFTARTSTGEIEELDYEPPHGIKHHYCKLALVIWRQEREQWKADIRDCRPQYPLLTELTSLFYVSGDGQEAMPGQVLPQPLQVGVANGQWLVPGARVRFRIVADGGNGALQVNDNSYREATLQTGPNGLVECFWCLDTAPHSQQVGATLLDAVDNPIHVPIYFNANLSVASQVYYNPEACTNLADVSTVQDAIDKLCQITQIGGCAVTVGNGGQYRTLKEAFATLQGTRDISLCLLAGPHEINEDLVVQDKNIIKIIGCSAYIWQSSKLLSLTANSILLQDLGLHITNRIGRVILASNEVAAERCQFGRIESNGGWEKSFRHVSGKHVAVDNSGGMFITGSFSHTVNFGGDDLAWVGGNYYDIFVVKFNIADGSHVWSKSFGDTHGDEGAGIAVDTGGHVVITGVFKGTVNFGGEDLSSTDRGDIFIVKLNGTDGGHIWSKNFGATGFIVSCSVTVNIHGDVVITGYFRGTVNFGGEDLISGHELHMDIFVVKLNGGDGSHIWSHRFGGTEEERGLAIAADSSGDVAITGYFNGTVNFGGDRPLSSAGESDIFVVKLKGGDGSHVWSHSFGGTKDDVGQAVAIDNIGDVVITGCFRDVVDFGGGRLTSAGESDIFVVKLNGGDGSHVWSRSFGGSHSGIGLGIAVDSSGDVMVTGDFTGDLDFDGIRQSSLPGENDIFVVKLNGADGNYLCSPGPRYTRTDRNPDVAVDIHDEIILIRNNTKNAETTGIFLRVERRTETPPLVLVKPITSSGSTRLYWMKNRMCFHWSAPFTQNINEYIIPSATVQLPEGVRKLLEKLSKMNPYVDKKSFEEALDMTVQGIPTLSKMLRTAWFKECPKAAIKALAPEPKAAIENFYTNLKKARITAKKMRENIEAVFKAFYPSNSAETLALEGGVGGWIEDNVIDGYIILHYNGSKTRYLCWGKTNEQQQANKQSWADPNQYLVIDPVTLNIRGNNVYAVYSNGYSIMQVINSILNEGQWPHELPEEGYKFMNVADNIFRANGSSFISQATILNGNTFAREITNESDIAVFVFGYAGVFVGNVVPSQDIIIEKILKSDSMREAANFLQIV